MTGFTATVTGDFSDNPRFLEWLGKRMGRAVVAGAEAVEKSHLDVVVGWERKPGFTANDIIDLGALYVARQLYISGPHAWKWILTNYGGSTVKNGPIVGKYMKFPFQGRGRSYLAATDTGSRGQRVGAPTVFFNIAERNVTARNMIRTVSRLYRRVILQAMRSAF